jgi:hypothetical protein
MPKGQYTRTTRVPPRPPADPPLPQIADAGVAIFRDRSGPQMGGGLTEGHSYAGEIQREAQSIIHRLGENEAEETV